MIKKFFEHAEAQFEPLTSFRLKDDLNPKVWEGDKIKKDIREQLLKIANDYFSGLDLKDVDLKDIMLTGSLANFNWSDYSDFDLHLLIDFSDINEDTELVKKYLDAAGKNWNDQHDIIIDGFDLEIYSQDVNEEHTSTGVYSLKNDKWIEKPSKQNFRPDEALIKKKAGDIMETVKELEGEFGEGVKDEVLQPKLAKIWKKIKDGRKAGLDRDGEFSIENLVFKLLRRNGFIEKIVTLKGKSYDKQFK